MKRRWSWLQDIFRNHPPPPPTGHPLVVPPGVHTLHVSVVGGGGGGILHFGGGGGGGSYASGMGPGPVAPEPDPLRMYRLLSLTLYDKGYTKLSPETREEIDAYMKEHP